MGIIHKCIKRMNQYNLKFFYFYIAATEVDAHKYTKAYKNNHTTSTKCQ